MGRPQVARENGWRWWQESCALLPLAASDYSALSQDVVFPAGITHRSVAIPIMEDSVLEAVESFFVSVTVPADHAGVVLLDTEAATINITDDDSKWRY